MRAFGDGLGYEDIEMKTRAALDPHKVDQVWLMGIIAVYGMK